MSTAVEKTLTLPLSQLRRGNGSRTSGKNWYPIFKLEHHSGNIISLGAKYTALLDPGASNTRNFF